MNERRPVVAGHHDRACPTARPSSAVVPAAGITIYGCAPDEAAMFHDLAGRYGVRPTTTAAALGEENVELARGARCVSVGHKTQIPNAALLALSRVGVRYLSTRSVGCNHLDPEYAASVGIRVGTVAYSPDSVADFTVMLMLMALRHAKPVLQRAETHDYRLADRRGRELRDLTVGVVGIGRIGAAVVERLLGFGCQILVHDVRVRAERSSVSLDALLRRSDVVTLHTPLDPHSHHLLDRRRIAAMRTGAVLVNTARGGLVDTEALVSALEDGRLGAAALDVVEGEEGFFYDDWSDRRLVSASLLRLQRLSNVIITPHTAFYTDHALADIVANSLAACVQFERENPRG
jgi:D-specific alpha-keto acid dehydrogenase